MAVVTIQIPIDLALRAGDIVVYDTTSKVISLAHPLIARFEPAAAPSFAAPASLPAEKPVTVIRGTETLTSPPASSDPSPSYSGPASYANSGGQFDRFRVLERDERDADRGSHTATHPGQKRRFLTNGEAADLTAAVLAFVVNHPECQSADIFNAIKHLPYATKTANTLWRYIDELIDDGMLEKRVQRADSGPCNSNPYLIRTTKRGREAFDRLSNHGAARADV